MSLRFFVCVFLLSSQLLPLSGQINSIEADTTDNSIKFKEVALPSSLLVLGVIFNNSQTEIDLKNRIREFTGDSYEFRIDDYFQYAPIAEMYIADMLGVESKNHWFDQTKNLLIADLTTSIIVRTLKVVIGKTRPNGAPYSFPSGHTSFAFTNASVLFHEFQDTSPVLAYSGYAFSTTTGIFRMFNNKHWLSDVLFGAGTGILVAQLVYHFDPIIGWNPFEKTVEITLVPTIYENYYGFYFSYRF